MEEDESDDVKPPAVVLDEHDVAGVMSLLIRVVRLAAQLNRDKELIAEVNARIAANSVLRSKTVTAFGAYGFDPGAEGLWTRVSQSLGIETYGRALAIGKGVEAPLLEKMGSEEADTGVAHAVQKDSAAGNHAPRVKDAILAYLQGLGDGGATARTVRQHLVDVHNLNVHEKTPGMTLYRLLQDGLVRREGRTWYANTTTENNEDGADAEPAFEEYEG